MKQIIYTLLLVSTLPALASDPSSSVYHETNSANNSTTFSPDGGQSRFKFFQFGETDKLFGSLAVSMNGDAQQVKFNAINYNLWFGGDKLLPFQLYLSDEVGKSDTSGDREAANSAKLLDPESGVAIKFPLLWTYQSDGNEFCAFLSKKNSIGHCSIGGDITFSFKQLRGEDGHTETAAGQTVRLGASMLFPILAAKDASEQGFLSFSAKAVYAHTNIDEPSLLFTPVTDSGGNPVEFEKSIASAELEAKWSFNQKLSIALRWQSPLDNKDYIDETFKISLENQF